MELEHQLEAERRLVEALEARFAGQEAAAHVSSLFDAGFQSAIEDAYEPANGWAVDALLRVAVEHAHADEDEDAEREGAEGDTSSDDDEDVWEGEDAWEGECGC